MPTLNFKNVDLYKASSRPNSQSKLSFIILTTVFSRLQPDIENLFIIIW